MDAPLEDTIVRPAPPRILVVDEEVAGGALLVRLLQGAGFSADQVHKPAAVLSLLRDGGYQAVLLDQNMPGTDGLTLLEKIRKEFEIPVIMMAGTDKSELAVRAIKAGAYDFLVKPLDEQKLLESLKKVLADGAQSGFRVSRYQIERELGRGGMGVVYAARDPHLDRPVALKLVLPELAADPEYELKFLAEARNAAKCSHPHVVAVYDAGRYQGHLYIAMEFVKGEPVESLVRAAKTLSPAIVFGLGIQVTSALDAMHSRGLIHGDLKPANLMMTSGSTVKILDFGLVRPLTPLGQETRRPSEDFAGTLSYAPPEALDKGKMDERGDLYALGVVMYELLTGLRAFESRSMFDLMHKILEGRLPKPVDEIEDVPDEGRALLKRLLSVKPEGRPPSAKEAQADVIKVRRIIGDKRSYTGRI